MTPDIVHSPWMHLICSLGLVYILLCSKLHGLQAPGNESYMDLSVEEKASWHLTFLFSSSESTAI